MQRKTQPVPVEDVQAAIPLGNCDVCEDANYEENTFRKEKDGDLTLVRTEYGVEAT